MNKIALQPCYYVFASITNQRRQVARLVGGTCTLTRCDEFESCREHFIFHFFGKIWRSLVTTVRVLAQRGALQAPGARTGASSAVPRLPPALSTPRWWRVQGWASYQVVWACRPMPFRSILNPGRFCQINPKFSLLICVLFY